MENMERKIKFGEHELVVKECYATKTIDEKEILKISVTEVEGDILKSLKENKSAIEYIKNEESKIFYEGYTENFVYSYREGIYDIELTKVSENTLKAKKATKNIEELNNTVHLLIDDVIPDLLLQIELLKGGEKDGRDNRTENHTSEESIVGKSEE